MLSCSCSEYDEDGWWFEPPTDYTEMPVGPRRKRCCSCREKIEPGACCTAFPRGRGPVSDIEERINGTEIRLASWWMCEECSDLFFSLDELGFCVTVGQEPMRELVAEYAAIYGRGTP